MPDSKLPIVIFHSRPTVLHCEYCKASVPLKDSHGWTQSGRSRRVFQSHTKRPIVFAAKCPKHQDRTGLLTLFTNPKESECRAIYKQALAERLAEKEKKA